MTTLPAVIIREALNLNRDMWNNLSRIHREEWYDSEEGRRISRRIDKLERIYSDALDKAKEEDGNE